MFRITIMWFNVKLYKIKKRKAKHTKMCVYISFLISFFAFNYYYYKKKNENTNKKKIKRWRIYQLIKKEQLLQVVKKVN